MKRKMIMVTNSNGQQINMDAYRVEFYTSVTKEDEYVDVTMHSGAHLILSNKLDQELYWGYSLTTLLDTILFGGDNEVVK